MRWKWRLHLTAAAGILFDAKCNYKSRFWPHKWGLILPSSHKHLRLSEWLQKDLGFYASIHKLAVCETQLRTYTLQGHWVIATREKDLLVFLVNLGSLRVEVGIREDSQSMYEGCKRGCGHLWIINNIWALAEQAQFSIWPARSIAEDTCLFIVTTVGTDAALGFQEHHGKTISSCTHVSYATGLGIWKSGFSVLACWDRKLYTSHCLSWCQAF
jgi:hypothetical protein